MSSLYEIFSQQFQVNSIPKIFSHLSHILHLLYRTHIDRSMENLTNVSCYAFSLELLFKSELLKGNAKLIYHAL